jgi:hypothetical protein
MAEFSAMSNEIDAARQQNTQVLQNPQLAVDSEEFYTKAEEAQAYARQLNHMETMGVPPAQDNLAHGQEVIIYGTSRLRAAVSAWIYAIDNDDGYDEWRIWWMERLMFEVVSVLAGHLSSSVVDTVVARDIHGDRNLCSYRGRCAIHSPTGSEDFGNTSRTASVAE